VDPSHEKRARALGLVSQPALWPQYPFLPVRRPGPGGGWERGVLYDARGVSGVYGHACTVFLTDLDHLPRYEAEFLGLPRHVYDNCWEVIEAGWGPD
jgi:hypothetical protein